MPVATMYAVPPPVPIPPLYQLPSSSMLSLPQYSPSHTVPSYTPEPSEDEQRLDFVARSIDRRLPQGTFTKQLKNITVTLSGQEEGASIPTYARNGVVRGELQLDGEENVLCVSMKLEGRQTLSVSQGGSNVRLLFAHTYTLWKKSDAAPKCPTILPFSIPFPLNYKEKGASVPVPPTFAAHYSGTPGLSGKNAYLLSVHITKPRLGSWKQHKTVSLPVRYHPRSRPFLPICASPLPFFSTLKTDPGEWHQVSSTVASRDAGALAPVDCHLFIPAVQIYAVGDTVPFHLQLRGARRSLRALVEPGVASASRGVSMGAGERGSRLGLALRASRSSSRSSLTSASSSNLAFSTTPPSTPAPTSTPLPSSAPNASSSSSSISTSRLSPFGALPKSARAQLADARPVVRVFILRQVTARVHFQKAWRSTVVGEGVLWPVHSGADGLLHRDVGGDDLLSDDAVEALDWEGEVRCEEDVDVGSFAAGDFIVKDFIVVHLCPPNPESSPLVEHQHAHPIRLVTDTYREAYDYAAVANE